YLVVPQMKPVGRGNRGRRCIQQKNSPGLQDPGILLGLAPKAPSWTRHSNVGATLRNRGSAPMLRLSIPCFLVASASLVAGPALAQQRLPTIAPEQYTAEQKKAAEEFLAARKTPVFGPFEPMMHSPEVMSIARAAGDYLRYHSAIGNRLSELVILITARE